MQSHGLTAPDGGWSFNNGCKYPKIKSLIWTCDWAVLLIFLHRVVLQVERIVLVNGSRLTRSHCTVRSKFQNHVYRLFKNFFNVDNVLAWRFKGFDSKSFCFCFFFFFFGVCLFAENPTTNIHGFKSDNFMGGSLVGRIGLWYGIG